MPDEIKDDLTKDDQVDVDQVKDADAAEVDEVDETPPVQTDVAGDAWTEDDLRLLSDEERAALFDDDDGDDEPVEGDDDAVEEVVTESEPATAQASDDDTPDDADDEPIKGTYTADVGAIDSEIEALDAAKIDAFDAFEEGDLSREDYLAKLKEIDATTKDATSKRALAKDREDAVYNSFISTAKSFFEENPELGGAEHGNAYDRHVRAVTGSEQYQHMTHRQMLVAAHKLYAAEADVLGIDVPLPKSKAAKAEPTPEPTPEPKPKPRARQTDKAPKTLANVPNAASVSVSDGKYSSLAQRLDGASAEDYEKIMGSMTIEEAEAFSSMDV